MRQCCCLNKHFIFFIFSSQIVNVSYEDFYEVYASQLKNDSIKLAFFMSNDDANTLNFYHKINGINLEERLFTTSAGIGLPKHSFLFQVTNEVVGELTSVGIMQFIDQSPQIFVEQSTRSPKVLDLEFLKFGFIIWLVAVSISFNVFLLELFTFYFLKKVKILIFSKFKEYFESLIVIAQLRNYLQNYRN